jgi:ABC-type Fe3+/spermidine/putrescine transport system ATPase subunit
MANGAAAAAAPAAENRLKNLRRPAWSDPLFIKSSSGSKIMSLLPPACVNMIFSMQSVLQLVGVSKHYPGHTALEGVYLEVRRGEFFALVGPSGCGKTTTLRLVAGLEDPTSGDIRLNGRSLLGLRPYLRNVSTVFQNYALFPHMTVAENVAFGLRYRGQGAGAARKVREMLDLVQLSGKESRYPAQLSGGEKQRVALARSLVLNPELLLLDEPLSALDPALRKQVRTELKEIQRRIGITFVFVTHDQEEAMSVSDRMAVMNHGRVEQVGAPAELYVRPATRFVASFLGAVNWIDGAGVRPESTRLSRSAPQGDALRAAVERITFLGDRLHVETRLASGETVTAQVSRLDGDFNPGEEVWVWWRKEEEMRFEA